jgi:TonB-linked SusC/RagA family outer membrane protein
MIQPRYVRRCVRRVLMISAPICAIAVTNTLQAQDPIPTESVRRARITGKVTDLSTGEPLLGANVMVLGTPVTATTGADGRFVIVSAPTGIFSIEARRLGYTPNRVENVRLVADSVTTLNFVMNASMLRLDQITVTGTVQETSVAKATITVDKLTSEDLPVPPTTSAAGAIAGKVAGVAITRPSGRPGSGVNIVLRTPISGITENGAVPSPLFVVDGIFLNQTQQVTTQDIEALDIESIEVIKGAAAASLYGSRAAAGVIAITTKRGKGLALGTNQFQLRNEMGEDRYQVTLDKNQHHQFMQDDQGNWLNAAGAAVPRAQRALKPLGIMDAPYTSPTYNHADLFYKPGSYNSQTMTVLGNSAATNYNLAYTRTVNPGVLDNNEGYRRQSFRVNVDSRLNEKLSVGISANHSRGVQDVSGPNFNNFYRIDTDVNLKEPAPFPAFGFPYVIVPDSVTLFTNPLYSQYIGDAVVKRARTLLNANGVFRPFEWLSIAADGNYDRGDLQEVTYTARGTPLVTTSGGLSPSTGRLEIESDITDGYVMTATATATKQLGGFTMRLSERGETRREYNPYLSTVGTDFATEGLKQMDQARTRTTDQFISDRRVLGAVTTLGVSYNEKYIADLLLRREGNSLFGRANRWNTFGRASFAWLLSEEEWFPFHNFNQFKLRYSNGVTGLSPNSEYQYEAMFSDGSGAIRRSNLGNVNISPTFTREEEIGLDMSYNSRITGSVTYVKNSSRDVFVNIPAPAVSGYQLVVTNPARLGGNILEATIQGAILTNPRGLQWSVLLVADKAWLKTGRFGRTCFDDGLQYKCDGIRLSEMWGNEIVRDKAHLPTRHSNSLDLFDINDEGFVVPVGAGNTWRDGVAKNLWGTTVLVDGVPYGWGLPLPRFDANGQLTYRKIGDSNPGLKYGLNNNFRYGNFRLYLQAAGQIGGDVYANSNQTYYASGDHPDVDQFGRPDSLKKSVRYYNAVSNNNNLFLANFVQSGTHLGFSEMLIGYTAEASRFGFLARMGVERMQIDLLARNLAMFTRYTGLNVMAGSPTVRFDDATYPLTRTFTGVVTITF